MLCSFVLSCLSETGLSENWPQWRGPRQNGTSAQTDLPEIIDPNHTLWTTTLPGSGTSTPIVCNAYVFVTAADKPTKTVMGAAINAKTESSYGPLA